MPRAYVWCSVGIALGHFAIVLDFTIVQYRYSSIILQFIDVLPKERVYYAQMQLY